MNALDKAINDYHNTDKTVAKILEENDIEKSYFYKHLDYKEKWREKHKARIYNFNLDVFIQDSHDKYYWIGFIAADGCIRENSLNIELKQEDYQHLIKFNNFCHNTNPITTRTNNNNCVCCRATINSYQLVKYLSQYNIVPQKTSIYVPPDNIPEKYKMDFIRGMIDGDGCIRINNHQQICLSFCSGNAQCVRKIFDWLKCDNKVSCNKNTYSVQVTGNQKAKKILDKIYENSTNDNRLERKYNIYKTLN